MSGRKGGHGWPCTSSALPWSEHLLLVLTWPSVCRDLTTPRPPGRRLLSFHCHKIPSFQSVMYLLAAWIPFFNGLYSITIFNYSGAQIVPELTLGNPSRWLWCVRTLLSFRSVSNIRTYLFHVQLTSRPVPGVCCSLKSGKEFV